MTDVSKIAIVFIETEKDRAIVPKVMDDIRTSLFSQEPTFIVVSGENENKDLSVALNKGIQAAIDAGCDYVVWAHPDMRYDQPNWHIPLMRILDTKPSVLKVCASNPRDTVGQLRLDQEQAWMMRTHDFVRIPGLFFSHEFKRIGGFEDWYQSFSIISSGYLVLVTHESLVYHEGMQTRKLRDTVQEQQDNSAVYHKLTAIEENPHQWKYFGCLLTPHKLAAAMKRAIKDFPEFTEVLTNTPKLSWQK